MQGEVQGNASTNADTTAIVVFATGELVIDGVAVDAPATFEFTSQDFELDTFSAVTTVVPVPAAAWMFGAALLSLGGLARLKRVS